MYGSGLVAQSEGNALGPWTFSATRFLIGALVLSPLAVVSYRKKSSEEREAEGELSLRQMIPGTVIIGVTLVVMVLTQQYGLMFTTVGKAGFITSLYVIGVPIAGKLLLRRQVRPRVWAAAVISVIGFYFISLTGGIDALNKGDMLLLLGSCTCVVYVYVIEFFAPKANPYVFTCLQFLITGILCIPGAIILEDSNWSMFRDNMGAILYAGIGICAAGYTLQMIGQKFVPSERASILLGTESLFSLFSGMLFLHEMMSGREYLGCALIFIAVMLAETGHKNKDNAIKYSTSKDN